jgi:hypothetical protein
LLLLTDNPVQSGDDDRYGFQQHARILCDAIAATRDLPLTVGLYGPWGSGKSSFLNICRTIFRGRGIPSVSFNPWKYDQRDEVWHALIQTVLDEISSGLDGELATAAKDRRAKLKQALDKTKALSKAATWLATRKLTSLVTAGAISAEDADHLLASWQERGAEAYRHVNRFESEFREVVTEFTGGKRLVVFIDDLDRCTPSAAVTVLDSIKLFLGEASCVFVIAMDHQMIVEAVASHLGSDETRARQYLEKLIHFPYHLPAVRFESLYSSLRNDVFGLGDDPALWELIKVAFGANPRRVRRFVNALNLMTTTLRLHSAPSRARLMQAAMLLALRFQFPAHYATVVADPDRWHNPVGVDSALFLDATHHSRTDLTFPQPPDAAWIAVLTDTLALAVSATGEESQGPL